MTCYACSSLHKTFFGGSRGSNKLVMPDMVIMGGGGGSSSGVGGVFKLLNAKKEFLSCVFANLIVQLGITYYVMMNFVPSSDSKQNISHLMLFFTQIFIIFILAFMPMPAWLKFIIFSVFSFTFGIILASLKKTIDPAIIKTALAGTMGIFGAMFTAGLALLLFGVQLGIRFGLGLLYALILLILASIVFMFMGAYSVAAKGFGVISLFLFSLFVIYDTNSILQRNYYGDFITASLDYYLDIVNIFVSLSGNSNAP